MLIFGPGNLKSLNDLAKQARADYIIHTGDFGFYDESSLDRIADKYVFMATFSARPNPLNLPGL